MPRGSPLAVLAVLMICTPSTPSWARRDLGSIPVGATAFVVCHGNLLAREGQEYVSQEPFPIVVDRRTDAAARETFNGASDTPEPRLSALFKLHLEASLGAAANAQCHLSDSVAAARSMLDFWQGQYGPPGNAPLRLLAWAPSAPDLRKARLKGRKQSALGVR